MNKIKLKLTSLVFVVVISLMKRKTDCYKDSEHPMRFSNLNFLVFFFFHENFLQVSAPPPKEGKCQGFALQLS